MFCIDDDRRPHMLEEEMLMEGNDDRDCDRKELLEFVKSICEEWPDAAISRILLRGADQAICRGYRGVTV